MNVKQAFDHTSKKQLLIRMLKLGVNSDFVTYLSLSLGNQKL